MAAQGYCCHVVGLAVVAALDCRHQPRPPPEMLAIVGVLQWLFRDCLSLKLLHWDVWLARTEVEQAAGAPSREAPSRAVWMQGQLADPIFILLLMHSPHLSDWFSDIQYQSSKKLL